MKSWTIKKQIILGLSILILINIVAGIFTCMGISKLKFFMENISTAQLHSVYALGQIQFAENDAYDLMLRQILADTTADADAQDARVLEAQANVDRMVDSFRQTTIFDEQERTMFAKTIAAREALKNAWAPARDLSLQLKTKDALDLFKRQTEPAIKNLRNSLQEEIDYNKQIADVTAQQSIALTSDASNLLYASAIIMLAAGLAIAFVIVRSLNRVLTGVADTLGEGANQIVAASGQLASASQSLAQNANEQAASLQETSSALEQIGSMTKRNTENATAAQSLSGETRIAAETGAQRTEEMQTAMKAIQKASTEMAVAIHGITTSSNSISKIISTIDEIAFQTNILALNAAVEAARAGEAGMGFAVVAEEVRSLAKRSADAAKETAALIEAAVAQSQLGVEVNSRVTARIAEVVQKANGVRESLVHIVVKAREVDSVVGQITEASKEQNTGLEQINSAINIMNQVTQANAANSEETASASEELTTQSMELRAGVDVLVKLVNGKSFDEMHPKRAAKAGEPARKPDAVPVKQLDLKARRGPTAAATNGNGKGNGHPDYDESFFDM